MLVQAHTARAASTFQSLRTTGAEPTAPAFSASPCLASQLQSMAPSRTKHLLLPDFLLPSLPSPCAKDIRQAPHIHTHIVLRGPPHVSPRMPQLTPLHLSPALQRCLSCDPPASGPSPAHTLNVYSPWGVPGLLLTVSGLGRTYRMEWSADPLRTGRQVPKPYLHIFYISFTLISVGVFYNTL